MVITKKVESKPQMTEQEYRAVVLDSYSSLKVYAEAPMKFYKTYVTKEIKREEPGKDAINGAIVHNLLERNDGTIDESKFLIATVGEIDKNKANQIELFALEIWKIMERCVDEQGNQTREFSSIAEEAFAAVKYDRNGEEQAFKKKDLAYAIGKFSESKAEQWLNQKRTAYGKTMVSIEDITNAEKIVEVLKTYRDTSWIYTQETNDRYHVYNELQVFFHHGGIDLKMMADKVIVDNELQLISPYDTKIGWNSNNFSKQYLENWYYLQAIVYQLGLAAWAQEQGIGHYRIEPMQFISTHSLCWYNPLIYKTTDKQLEDALNGFTTSWGRRYMGLSEIIENLQWSLENAQWKISKKDYENNSVKQIEY